MIAYISLVVEVILWYDDRVTVRMGRLAKRNGHWTCSCSFVFLPFFSSVFLFFCGGRPSRKATRRQVSRYQTVTPFILRGWWYFLLLIFVDSPARKKNSNSIRVSASTLTSMTFFPCRPPCLLLLEFVFIYLKKKGISYFCWLLFILSTGSTAGRNVTGESLLSGARAFSRRYWMDH